MQFADWDLLVLVKLRLKLRPAVDIDALVGICLKDLDYSIEPHHHCHMIVFAICNKPLQGALCVTRAHQHNVPRLRNLQKLTLRNGVFLVVKLTFRLDEPCLPWLLIVLDYTTDCTLPACSLAKSKSFQMNWKLVLFQLELDLQLLARAQTGKSSQVNAAFKGAAGVVFEAIELRRSENAIADLNEEETTCQRLRSEVVLR